MTIILSVNDIKIIDEWLDGAVSEQYKFQKLAQDWARISKVSEELGEAIQCFIGATGQNPRKGVINDIDDVLEELADTAITAILAIQHFTKDVDQTGDIMNTKLASILKRVP
jgi:hypothetical protein